MKKIILTLAVLCCLGIGAVAQSVDTTNVHAVEYYGTLKGMISDIRTEEVLPFCKVVLMQDGKQILVGKSDIDGCYTLKRIPVGDYTLRVERPSYHQFEHDVTVNKTGFTIMHVCLVQDSVSVNDICTPTFKGVPVIEISGPESSNKFADEIQVKLPGTPTSQPESDTPHWSPEHSTNEILEKLISVTPQREVGTMKVVRYGNVLIGEEEQPEEPKSIKDIE